MDDLDGFEVFQQFNDLLARLSGQREAVKNVTRFAHKHIQFADDLYGALVGRIRETDPKQRIFLLHAIDSILNYCKDAGKDEYLDLVQRDAIQVYKDVLEGEGSSSQNSEKVRKVLKIWRTRKYVTEEQYNEIENLLGYGLLRDIAPQFKWLTVLLPLRTEELSRNDILKRMEDDREKHKKARENVWCRTLSSEKRRLIEGKHGTMLALTLVTQNTTIPSTPSTPSSAIPLSKRPPQQPYTPSQTPHTPPTATMGLSAAAGGAGMNVWFADEEFEDMWGDISDLDDRDFQILDREEQKFARIMGRKEPERASRTRSADAD
ncbi:CTD kinase subunit gamma CTK3-domain-containing protein [Cladochytrium replicatum]|nr:CTD kinase subunit gamma CTK3-domain-containing protein [Cladochytrium replicatum]